MDQKNDIVPKQDEKSEDKVSRTQSQDALDSSSASSLSFLADHCDAQNNYIQENEKSADGQKSGDCSPRAPMDEALKSEKAFIEFVMSLPPKESSEQQHRVSTDSVMSKVKSPTPGSTTTKVGLDHLDNLCKLMEQLSELRETNNKLQRRVQYLEDLKTLHDMHKEISEEAQYSSEDALTSKPRPYELKKSATETCCPKKEDTHIVRSARTHSKYPSRRGRAQSADGQRRERSKSVGHEDTGEDTKSKRIFPKWSKVKEAFGWESDRKDSVKIKGDCDAGIIRAPRRCSDDSHNTFHPPKSPTWSQDYPSLHSSLEDVQEILDSGRWKRTSVASEKNVVYLDTPKECLRRQKSTPSPGSEKLIPFREISDLKPKSSTIERDSYGQQDYSKFEKDDGKRGKSPWGRVKTIIERRRDSLKRRSIRREHTCADCDSTSHKKVPEVAEIKSYADYVESSVRQPVISDTHRHKNYVPDPIVIDEEVDYGGPRTPSSSPTFHRKSRWTRVKKALTGKKEDDRDPSLSTPASPNSGQDGHFTFDIVEEITQDDAYDDSPEIKRVGSDSHVHQLSLSAPTCDLMLQLQRNLSDDFHRKIMEWERIRSSGNASCSPQWDRKPSLTTRSRKKSERDDKNIKPKLKDLTWLEKELQKIEKEKQRLSKERQKYEERALRLEKLKETVLNAKNSNKREVFVRTSAGEFRFEGISDAFTKKLYEWETKRGLGPELSTIALLDSSRLTVQSSLSPKSGPLQRVVSRSESSVADIGGQPSHNSSNSLPSLKMSDALDADRTNHPSRANSEPDLSTLAALTNGNNVSVTNLSREVDDSLDDGITGPGASRESEEDELEKKRNDSETYYGLLEENVILLEQLKDKEEICSRLQKELEVLDKKVDVMNEHHTQETERYREKLWEMHKPGATPRDQQCCLLTMSQLRKRIEVLEKCTEKLRNDRETVEDSFRYHSKQQEDMTLDLLQKMSELQAAGSSTAECEPQEYIPPRVNASAVERLQDLSALLVKQTQELQETLSAKTRQICQLRWELLHRDLSTVKLETELHSHTAHRKRSKYAHYRSHSSEEAPVVPLPQELECAKSTLVTEAYYNVAPENEFQATELTNTVQQLNREVLKLAGATDGVAENIDTSEGYKSNNEKFWVQKTSSKTRKGDKCKQITVRRSSADNVNAMLGRDERWKQNDACSSDSDSSSDDGYTRILFRPSARNNCFPNSDVERLLMSSGEHPPRGYLQRRKLQKLAKSGSTPNRRRSNTFHNKRDYEKPVVFENTPQKFYSFRLPTERNFAHSESQNKCETINIRNLLGEVKYREFLKKRAQMCRSNNGQAQISIINKSAVRQDNRTDCQWLREVASDSKIPLLFQLQYRTDELLRDKYSSKCPVRSLSDKHGKETAAERRQIFQKRKNKIHLTSPDLFSNLNETLKARLLSRTPSQHKTLKGDESKCNFNATVNTPIKRQHSEKVPFTPNIPLSNSENTVTIQLPKRKSKKSQSKPSQDSSESTEQTITIVMPKKRSLSSEQEYEDSSKNTSSLKVAESLKDRYDNQKGEISAVPSVAESNSYPDVKSAINSNNQNSAIKPFQIPDSDTIEAVNGRLQNESNISRKRKAEDSDSLPKVLTVEESDADTDQQSNISNQNVLSSNTEIIKSQSVNYIKSPSDPHLDWRKGCAKKVSKEGAPNVRSLIEKYNKVAESQQLKSPNSSNLSSPTWSRKISAPIYTSKSERAIPLYSSSTPTTPSVLSACTFYNPLIFKPINLDLFPKSAPESPLSAARNEAIKKAKEQFIASQNTNYSEGRCAFTLPNLRVTDTNNKRVTPVNHEPTSLSALTKADKGDTKGTDDDRVSNCSMDSTSLVMYRTGETCQESRFSKRSFDHFRTESDTIETKHSLKTSKSLSNSSIFKSVLNSDFKIPSTFLKLKRSKRKKDMATVSKLCRQSLLITTDDSEKVSSQSSHKSCPSSPELKNKSEVKSNWFHRNILRHK